MSLTGFSLVGGPAYNDSQAAEAMLADLIPEKRKEEFEAQGALDFSAQLDNGDRFRVNMFRAGGDVHALRVGVQPLDGALGFCTSCQVPVDGRYLSFSVEDTGSGIPPDAVGRIFDPFFTTKGVGKGTGLGLSTVYGIVKQTGGFIFCDSEMGKGTTFKIYLPRYYPQKSEATIVEEKPAEAPKRDYTGKERILLVEDEDAVRAFALRALTSRGYTVVEAD